MHYGKIDIAYQNDSGDVYNGAKRFEVSHLAHKKPLIVAAPDDKSAMVATAKRWGDHQGMKAIFRYPGSKWSIANHIGGTGDGSYLDEL